jgi:uncharacterized tellurite resistance protein B-like protein
MITILMAAAAIDGVIDEVELEEARTLLYGMGVHEEDIVSQRLHLESLAGSAYMASVLDAVYHCRSDLERDGLRRIFDTVFAMIMADGQVTEEEKHFYRLLDDVWHISRV